MKKIELGKFVSRKTYKSQPVLQFENYHYLLLYEKYHTVFQGKEGIGLNPRIVGNIDLEKLVIEVSKENKFYLLESEKKIWGECRKDVQKGTALIVLPFEEFSEVCVLDKENIPRVKAVK